MQPNISWNLVTSDGSIMTSDDGIPLSESGAINSIGLQYGRSALRFKSKVPVICTAAKQWIVEPTGQKKQIGLVVRFQPLVKQSGYVIDAITNAREITIWTADELSIVQSKLRFKHIRLRHKNQLEVFLNGELITNFRRKV